MIWRWASGALALMLAVAAVVIWQQDAGKANPAAALPAAPRASADFVSTPMPAPEATPQSREQRRFARYDKDRNGGITRAEYLASRRKAYAKLDTNGDGLLSFEEWAVKTTTKFTGADADRSGVLVPAEFATTAAKRKAKARPDCPPTGLARDGEDGDES